MLERLEKKAVKEAEANMSGAFHCKTPDCAGWTVIGRLIKTTVIGEHSHCQCCGINAETPNWLGRGGSFFYVFVTLVSIFLLHLFNKVHYV